MYERYIAYGWSTTHNKIVPRYVGIGHQGRHRHCLDYHSHNPLVESHKQHPQWRVDVLSPVATDTDAFSWEIATIAEYGRIDQDTGTLFNMTAGGDGARGRCVSLETRNIVSKQHKGKIVSDNTKQKLRDANIGKTLSDNTKRAIGIAAKNRSEETLAKIAYASSLRTHTCETKAKIGAAQTGKIVSAETRKKQRNAKVGSTHATKGIHITPHGAFRTLKDAAQSHGCSQQTILNRCTHKNAHINGYMFVKNKTQ